MDPRFDPSQGHFTQVPNAFFEQHQRALTPRAFSVLASNYQQRISGCRRDLARGRLPPEDRTVSPRSGKAVRVNRQAIEHDEA